MTAWPGSLRTAVGICLGSRFPMFVWWGPDLVNIYNDAYVPVLGQRHPDALGRPARELWGEIWPVLGPQADAVMTRGEATWNERVLLVMERHGYAEETWFTWSYSPIPDAAGGVGGLFCACTEETPRVLAERERDRLTAQRREAEERLRRSEERARTLIDFLPGGAAFLVDPELRYLLAGGEALRAAGLEPEDFVGKTVAEAVDPALAADHERFYRQALAGTPFTHEHEAGGRAYVSRGVPMRDGAGGVYAVLAFSHDVTDRKVAEARAQDILESVTDGFFSLDRDWRFAYVNAAAERFLLRGRGELVGRNIWAEFPAALGTHFEREYRRAMAENVTTLFVEHYPAPLDRWYEARAYPSATGLSVYFQDITERRRAEEALREARERLEVSLGAERAARLEAERASRMKDEFLATLSHELRTPLNAILGWSQILARGDQIDPDTRDGLAVIERNARTQAELIEDLLDMSRIVSGTLRLDVQPVDLPAVVKAAVETVRPAADAKGIGLQVILDPAAGPVWGDPRRLQQVCWNLLSNAVKFTPKRGQVGVVLGRVNSHLEVGVTDTGEGISPEFLPHVFDRFRQADGSTTRRHGGVGLGLAICKQLVELHGGSVRVKSPGTGKGSTFTVVIPVAAVRPGPDGGPGGHRPSGPGGNGADAFARLDGLRVLVVDDEPDARFLVQRLLEDCGAVVRAAGSAEEAMALVGAEVPEVIVSDVGMPGEDGYSLIRRVRSLPAARGGTVPALALTAYARSEDRVRATHAGFHAHVTKPVEPVDLVTAVATLAGRAGA
ncbi:MAG: rpfC [Phycisphaerales bacterium]|nr:rpfC [Phycisphaerales bacterium]